MIEQATLDDVETLSDLWVALARDQREHGSHVLGPENETVVRQSIGEKVIDGRVFVAREDGDVVGFVSVGFEEGSFERDVSRGIVENVYVARDHRNRGLGTALIERAEEELVARGADVVTLEVLLANEDARRLYERLGYADHRVELEKQVGSDNH